MKSNYLLINKVTAPLAWTRARIYKSSHKEVSNAVSCGKYQQSSLFRRYTRRFGCTVCNRDLKSAMEEATEIWTANPQKKPCFRKWEYQGKTAFYHSCTVYISWLFRMPEKCVGNLGRTIDLVSTKSQKEHCNSFSLGKGGKARWFLNLSHMRTNKWLRRIFYNDMSP